MNKALVTGGCGFLGAWIVRELLSEGVEVRVQALPGEPTDNIADVLEQVELVRGNVLSRQDCEAAVESCDTVFHVAAMYKDDMADPTLMYEVNDRGTFNMMEASRRAGVDTVIYTASVVSIGRSENGNEDTPYDAWEIDFHYSRSKYHSREIAESFAAWDMDVRVVCPAIVIGPGDVGPTPSGKLLITMGRYIMPPVYVAGGVCYVDVRDAAKVHVLAAKNGKAGERYVAAGHNFTNEEFIGRCQKAVGRRGKLRKVPSGLAQNLVGGVETAWKLFGQEPPLTRTFFSYSLKTCYFDNRKSREELGATYRPFDETLRDAVADFKRRGLIRT